jgi:signal transduction histidine kinase
VQGHHHRHAFLCQVVRKSTYEKRAFSLNEITDKTIELIGFQGRLRNIEVVKAYADEMPTVEGNEGELRQVILIIIMNALDAMGDSGRLHIQTGTEGGTAFIKVTDSGIGIPPENLPRIFDPFFTTKSDKGGTGLGLSIANKIVVNHNGVIYATSEEGLGSTFKVVLPLS